MEKEFDRKSLAEFDGRDGRPAYVAVDGIVYDVTNISAWKDGTHHGNHAGQDLSEAIKHAPHEKSVLAKLTKVGKLID